MFWDIRRNCDCEEACQGLEIMLSDMKSTIGYYDAYSVFITGKVAAKHHKVRLKLEEIREHLLILYLQQSDCPVAP